MIVRIRIRKRIRSKDKQTLWLIMKCRKMGVKLWERNGGKLRGKETLMTVENDITG